MNRPELCRSILCLIGSSCLIGVVAPSAMAFDLSRAPSINPEKTSSQIELNYLQRKNEQLVGTSITALLGQGTQLGLGIVGGNNINDSKAKYSHLSLGGAYYLGSGLGAQHSLGLNGEVGKEKRKIGGSSQALFILKQSVNLTVSLGYLQHGQEKIENLILVNEGYGDATLSYRILSHLNLQAGTRFRTVAMEQSPESPSKRYSLQEYRFGMSTKFGHTEFGAFAQTMTKPKAYPEARQSFGLSLSYDLTARPSSDHDATASEDAKDKGLNGLDTADISRDIDSISERQRDSAGNNLDAFQLAGERAKQRAKIKKPLSDEEAVTQELEALRETERKQRAAEDDKRRRAEGRSQRQTKRDLAREKAEIGSLKGDVRKEINNLPTVQDDDVAWKGLESK